MPLSDFTRLEPRAEDYLDAVTMGRTKTFDDVDGLLAKACCELCDAALHEEKGGDISQENNDGYAVTYTKGISNTKTFEQKQWAIVQMYLGETGMLYRGA